MHRSIASSVLLFWAVMFAGLAHLSLAGILNVPIPNPVEFQLLFLKTSGLQVMPVLLMVISAFFGWALLALVMSDQIAFREIEAYAYAMAVFMMCACAILAFLNAGIALTTPTVLVAGLVTSAAASRHLALEAKQYPDVDYGRDVARRMALAAAHNSLLSRVSGRPSNRVPLARNNVMLFPTKPTNGG